MSNKINILHVVLLVSTFLSLVSGQTTPEITTIENDEDPCFGVTCPTLSPNLGRKLEHGEVIKVNREQCCPFIEFECDKKLCPLPKPCDDFLVLQTIKGKCCPSYECVEPPNKCIVELEEEDVQLNLGEVFISPNNPCEKFECIFDEKLNKSVGKKSVEICIEDCNPSYEYERDPDQCCGKCVQTKCILDDKMYAIGELWQSEDKCMFYQCEENNGLLEISEFSKSNCPKVPPNCPQSEIYTQNCCQYCNVTFEHLPAASEPTSVRFEKNETDYLDEETYKNHPCARDCQEGEEPMTCNYKFVIEWYETRSKACFNCPENITDCSRPHCIAADGARRSIMVINRMLPGPMIQVCKGDTIIVDVKNELLGESTTIHWHGLHQRANPYMDGVPHISQCPIPPHTTFRYTFEADAVGTHFWHSHTGMQRGDGTFGPLIIKEPKTRDPHANLYDFDLNEHVMSLNDWAHEPGVTMFASHHHSLGDNKPPNLLINGKGKYYFKDGVNKGASMPPTSTTLELPTTTASFTDDISTYPSTLPSSPIISVSAIDNAIEAILKRHQRMTGTNVTASLPQKGRERVLIASPESELMPLSVFTVKQNSRYKFRVINAGFLNCPIELSVDNHNITVIASDGFPLVPIETTALIIYAGERFDFIIDATQEVDNYWIRYRGLMDCGLQFTQAHQVAVLRYEGAADKNPDGKPTWNYFREGLQVNALNKGMNEENHKSIPELEAWDDDHPALLNKETDYKFYIYYDFYDKDNPHFHHPNLYGFHTVPHKNSRLYTPQLNHISMKMPAAPLMLEKEKYTDDMFCNDTYLASKGIDCRKEFCECHHILQVHLNSTVELIIIDEGFTFDANHPFHLHGNAFRVVGMERLGSSVKYEDVVALDHQGKLLRNLNRAPIKDTVTVPDGGYTIVRFVADNPGYWLLHCHIEFHAEIGMSLVIKVGDHSEMPPVPKGFPTCHDYMPSLDNPQPEPEESPKENSVQKVSQAELRLLVAFVIFLILRQEYYN